MSWLKIVIHAVIVIGIVIFIIIFSPSRQFSNEIKETSIATQFNPTFYEIYDKSTSDTCERLIIVQPFKWIIWAILGQVYILNDNHAECPQQSTPATLVPVDGTNTFPITCLQYPLIDIIALYKDKIPKKVPFQIEGERFTILDALNSLFKFAITMNGPPSVQEKIRSKRALIEHINPPQQRMQTQLHSYKKLSDMYKLAIQKTRQ